MADWPTLTRYGGQILDEIAFPLGDIGTGTIAPGGRAELRDFELFNHPAKGFNPPFTFFALRAQRGRQPAVTRILEGVLRPLRGHYGSGRLTTHASCVAGSGVSLRPLHVARS